MNIYEKISDFEDFLQIEKNLSKNTISAYLSDLHFFFEYIQNSDQNTLETIVAQYIEFLRNNMISSASIARKISAIKQFYKFNDIVINVHLPKISNNMQIVDYKIIVKILEDIEDIKLKAFLYLLFATGGRVSEVLSIKKNDIIECIKTQKLHFTIIGKGKKERVVFITSDTLEILKHFLSMSVQNDKQLYLFQSGLIAKPMTRQWAHKMLKQLCLKMNVEHLHPHSFRHAQAMMLLESGVDLISIKELLGHAHLSTTERYLQLHWKHLKEAIDKHPLNH